MVAARQRMNNNRPTFTALMAQKARLLQRRTLAMKVRDEAELTAVAKELTEMELKYPEVFQSQSSFESGGTPTSSVKVEDGGKKAEEKRKALAEAEKRRRAMLGALGRPMTPTTPVVRDLSARVKTESRIGDGNGISR